MVILGLGKAGSNIANLFKVDKNYKVFTYDGGANVPVQSSAEEYEKKFTKKRELSRIKNKTRRSRNRNNYVKINSRNTANNYW